MMAIAARFSPLHDALHHHAASHNARWIELGEMEVPLNFGNPTAEITLARTLALADVSPLTRVVIKGPRAAEFLQSQGVAIPAEVLKTLPLEAGGILARTGNAEFFLEDGPQGTTVPKVESALGAGGQGVYRVLRQDASILLSGSKGSELLRQACSYDFIGVGPENGLVMTRMAGVSCMVLPRVLNGIPTLQLWTDGTYGLYLWESLLEIVHELQGGVVGLGPFCPELNRQ